MIRSASSRAITRLVACLVACSVTPIAAAQIMPAPTTPNATPGGSALTDWNVTYRVPAGWRVGQTMGRLQMIVSNTDAGMIFLAPGMYSTAQEAFADLSAFYSQMQMQAYPVEQPAAGTIAGMQSITATYASADQTGRTLHGRYIALITSHGTGVNLLAMTTPDKMPALRGTLEQLATSVKAGPPSVNRQAVAALAGQWILYAGKSDPVTSSLGGSSRSHEETVVFDGRGSYRWSSSTSVSVTTGGSSGGSAGSATSDGDQGTYTVIGNTLVFKGTKGQLAVDFQLGNGQLVAAGKTYLRQ
jgi:hypothetical protein